LNAEDFILHAIELLGAEFDELDRAFTQILQ